MPYELTVNSVQEVLAALCGSYDIELGTGRVRLLARHLDGNAVCSILPDIGDGVLRIVYDLGKPNAVLHVQAMVQEWWESMRQPVTFPDGSVEMIRLPCPRPAEVPARIAVLPLAR